ncbi:iron-sulfur cluster assembly 1 homolog, mitochondrial-like [Watersipora subatra]|uniref:iron-sulfur cluster assembly 1 homolog, mitochondrial-like n=1 Tax=Watersipora subatra TaxID=2589382 RepID=UPI00355B17F5
MSSASRLTATVRAATKRRNFRPTRAAITLTPAAVKRVKDIMEGQPDVRGLKIGVKTRGCRGLSYTLDYATEISKLDEQVDQDGAKIFIDSKAQMSLLGTVMDYVDEKLTSEFVFENPNVTGFCGCGESFSLGNESLPSSKPISKTASGDAT